MTKVGATTNEKQDNSMARKGNCFHSVWIGWIRICRKISDFIENLFDRHTRFITSHHTKVIIGCFIFVALMAIGAIWFNALQRNEELFIPQGSEAFERLDDAQKLFPDIKYRVQDIVVSRNDGGNILNDTILFTKALELHKKIEKLKDYENVCLKHTPPSGGAKKCLVVTTLEIFGFDASNINNIPTKFNMWLQNQSLLLSNGRNAQLNFPNILGKYKNNGNSVSFANAVRVTYYTKYVDTKSSNYDDVTKWEDELINLCGDTKDTYDNLQLTLNYFAARTRDDAILASTVGDLPLFSVAFILMVAFCLVVFLRWKNKVTGHLTVAIMGICVIMLGVGCGFGFSMWIRTDFVAFTGILMFLILGIGMDNMFIIIEALESVNPDVQGEERLVVAMKHIGGSITMTTTTDLVAFAVSTVSDFPAVHLFCVYAALSIFFAYAFLITLFLALLTWDIHRIERGQRDILPCRKPIVEARGINPWLKTEDDFSKRLLRKWGKILMTVPMRVVVFFAACGLLAAGIYGTTEITQKFEWKKLSRDGSYFRNYAEMRDDNFPAGYDVSIVMPVEMEYSSSTLQQKIVNLDYIAGNNSRFEKMTLNWMKGYTQWASANSLPINTEQGFYANLENFLSYAPVFKADVNIDANTKKVTSSRVVFFYENNNDAINQAEAMKSIRTDLKDRSGIAGIYPISIMFIYAEQFAAVLDDTVRNLAIAGGTIVIITIPYLIHPGITGLVFLSFTSLLFELLGIMTAWDVSLDVVAMIIITMAIGFSVDYTCHIAHAYMISHKDSPEERAIDALSTMGVSVLNGGISTFLGMLITAFSGAEGFRIFFKMVFSIVVLGLIHGLVFLPVLLSIFVRRDLREDMKEFVDKHDQEERLKSQERFKEMSEEQRRKQSIMYRRQSSKPAETKEDIEMSEKPVTNDVHSNGHNGTENVNNGADNPGYNKTEIQVYYKND